MIADSVDRPNTLNGSYRHNRWEFRRRFLRFLIQNIGFNLLAKIDHVIGVENIPVVGSGIIMINHVAFIDSIVTLNCVPRNIVPMAKIEVYDYPFIGIFPRMWGVIPVRREEVDRQAIRQALDVLRAGELILMAPEGTRGPQLQQGKVGVAYIASRSGAPVIPVAITGTPGFPALRFSARWREPGASVRFGRPFSFRSDLKHPSRDLLRQMTDEAMYVLASMLPEKQRGVYSDLTKATQETICWV